MNKALDYNKLLEAQGKGKLLKKRPKMEYYVSIKYDGNYTTVIKDKGEVTFITSGGKHYTNNTPTIFEKAFIPSGVYLCERIGTQGKLGDRVNCALKGTRNDRIAYGHKYRVFDFIDLTTYNGNGVSIGYNKRRYALHNIFKGYTEFIVEDKLMTMTQAEAELKRVTDLGYEGIMLKHPEWVWKDTKSRTVDFMKWKRRPTADLLVVDTVTGAGKYSNQIGSLVLKDSEGRTVRVGSGMSDMDRATYADYWIGKVVEIEYEQIINTYIQPTFNSRTEGVIIRYDKTAEDID